MLTLILQWIHVLIKICINQSLCDICIYILNKLLIWIDVKKKNKLKYLNTFNIFLKMTILGSSLLSLPLITALHTNNSHIIYKL